MIISSKIISTDNILFLTQFKIGTRYLLRMFGKQWVQMNFDLSDLFNLQWEQDDSFWNIEPENHSHHSNMVNTDLKKLSNGDIDKDVVLLFRDPYQRMTTGLVQDLMDRIQSDGKLLEIDMSIDNMNNIEWESINMNDVYNTLEEYLLMVCKNNSIQNFSNHNNKYLYLYVELFRRYPNIKLVELHKLKSYLDKKNINTEYETTTNGVLNQTICDVIDNNKTIDKYINFILSDEVAHYKTLKKYSI